MSPVIDFFSAVSPVIHGLVTEHLCMMRHMRHVIMAQKGFANVHQGCQQQSTALLISVKPTFPAWQALC